MSRLQMVLVRAALLGVVLAAWEFLPRQGIMDPQLLPPLSDVLSTLVQLLQRPNVHTAIGVTGAEVIVAFLIAVPLGTALGVLVAENEYIGAVFKPLLFYVFSIPKSIFLPMFILVFGISFAQKVAYAAFTTTFVVLMSAAPVTSSGQSLFVEFISNAAVVTSGVVAKIEFILAPATATPTPSAALARARLRRDSAG